MKPNSSPLSTDQLLDHEPWVRKLARRLLDDDHRVDDVVQQTLLAAIERPPEQHGRLTSWLATVTRNNIRYGYRQDQRRIRRETLVARPERERARTETLELDELRARVVTAVVAMQEPYQSTLVLRYYEDLETDEIARRLGVAQATVRVRLMRAHQQLRQRLQSLFEGRDDAGPNSATILALLALPPSAVELLASTEPEAMSQAIATLDLSTPTEVAPHAQAPAQMESQPSLAGGNASSAKWWIGSAALLLVGMLLWWFIPVYFPAGPGAKPSERASTSGFSAVAPSPDSPESGSGKILSQSSPRALTIGAESGALASVRVVDSGGLPIAGAELWLGSFSMDARETAVGLSATTFLMRDRCSDSIGKTDARGVVSVDALRLRRDPLSVRAPGYLEHRESVGWRGLVDGVHEITLLPALTARLTVRTPAGQAAQVGLIDPSGKRTELLAQADGSFIYSYERARYVVQVQAEGCAAVQQLAEAPAQEIVLEAGASRFGFVRTATGKPCVGCEVRINTPTWKGPPWVVLTDSDGRFETPAVPSSGEAKFELVANDHPWSQARRSLAEPSWEDFEVPTGHWVKGRVRDERGRPVAAGHVLLFPQADKFYSRRVVRAPVESDGTFALGPVVAQSYVVRCEPSVGAPVEAAVPELNERASTQEVFVDLKLEPADTVRVRVVTAAGEPAPGVALRLGSIVGDEVRGDDGITDQAGQVVFTRVPRDVPPARPRRADLRWGAVVSPEEPRPRALVLEVYRPHQLLEAEGREVPAVAHYGSRNTCRVSSDNLLLVVEDGAPEEPVQFDLRDPEGRALRVLTNVLVISGDGWVMNSFAGMTGRPWNLPNTGVLDGAWVTARNPNYTWSSVWIDLGSQGSGAPNRCAFELSPRRPHSILLVDGAGQPIADQEVLVGPATGPRVGAIPLGATDANGRVDASMLGPGEHQFFVPDSPDRMTGSTGRRRNALPGEWLVDIGVGTIRESQSLLTLKWTAQSSSQQRTDRP